jgi:hypothetical protein
MIEHIEGRMFTKMTPEIQVALIILTCILALALCLTVADKNIKRDNPAWIDPAQELPPTETAIIGLYLIDGHQEPIRVMMFYNFDKNLGKLEWWQLDNDSAQNNLGRPYRWTRELIVPDLLLWSSKKGR